MDNIGIIICVLILLVAVFLSAGRSQSKSPDEWTNEQSWNERRAKRGQIQNDYASTNNRHTAWADAGAKRLRAQLDNQPVLNMGDSSPRLTDRTNKPIAGSGKTRKQIESEVERFWSDPDAARKYLAKTYHPDRNPPELRDVCNEIMKDINQRADQEKRERGRR